MPASAQKLSHKEFSKTESIAGNIGVGYEVFDATGGGKSFVGYLTADSGGHWVYGHRNCSRSLLKSGQLGYFEYRSSDIRPADTDMYRVRDNKR